MCEDVHLFSTLINMWGFSLWLSLAYEKKKTTYSVNLEVYWFLYVLIRNCSSVIPSYRQGEKVETLHVYKKHNSKLILFKLLLI